MRKSSKKLGFVAETSDCCNTGFSTVKPEPILLEPKLLAVSHYHQREGCNPVPNPIPEGTQCFELMTDGRGWVECDGQWVEVNPGDLLWHLPGDYTIGRSDFMNPYRCLAVRVQGIVVDKSAAPRITHWDELDEVRRFTRQVVRLHADDQFDSLVLMRYIVSRLQFQAQLYRRGQSQRGLPGELQRAMQYLERHFAEPLRLKELAKAAGWSVPHLHDRFKEELGLSPHQALIRRRIQAARELLASTNDPVKSVSSRCGFPTAAAFCAQFKKITQLSPKEYRKRQHYGAA